MNSPESIEYQHNDDLISVTVYPANGIKGTRRNRVRSEQLSEVKRLAELTPPIITDKDEFIFRVVDYPDMIGASDILINGVKTEPPYEVVKDWPDEFTGAWSGLVSKLNPHWLDPEYNKKKATT